MGDFADWLAVQTDAAQTLTIDYGRSPGQNFQRKILSRSFPPSPSSYSHESFWFLKE